jgi:hypothetical protein
MAWTAVETFNTYSDGDLAGNNGGSGWSGAWVNAASEVINVQGTTVYEGAKAVSNNGAGNYFYTRDLSSSVGGDGNVIYVAIRRSSTSTGELSFSIRNASNGSKWAVRLNASGNLTLVGATTTTVLAGYSANTWYAIRLTFNVTSDTAVVAYSTSGYQSGGSWSSDSSSVAAANTGNVDRIGLGGDLGSTTLYDYISGVDPLPAGGLTTVKTWDNIAIANLKTLNGVAKANIKSINGNT